MEIFRRASSSGGGPEVTAATVAAAEVERAVVLWVLQKEGKVESNSNNKGLVLGIANRVKTIVKKDARALTKSGQSSGITSFFGSGRS